MQDTNPIDSFLVAYLGFLIEPFCFLYSIIFLNLLSIFPPKIIDRLKTPYSKSVLVIFIIDCVFAKRLIFILYLIISTSSLIIVFLVIFAENKKFPNICKIKLTSVYINDSLLHTLNR